MSYPDEYHRLTTALSTAKPEPALDLLQELADAADAAGDDEVAEAAVRNRLKVANELGRFDLEFAAFQRLAAWHAAGRSHLRDNVLWYYKWIAEKLPEYPTISRPALEEFFDKMEACFRAEKANLRPVFGERMTEAAFAGQTAEADAWRTKWENEPEDKSDDCPACETHRLVDMLLHAGRSEEAIEAAKPILSGDQGCAEVPATTFSRLLLPLLGEGKGQAAELCHGFVLRQVRKTPKLLRHLAEHVVYLTLTGRSHEARRLVTVMLIRDSGTPSGWDRFRVAGALWMWAAARDVDGQAEIRLPRGLSWTKETTVSPKVLIDRARTVTADLAKQFDARNGTDAFARRVENAVRMEAFLRRPRTDDENGDATLER